MDDSRRDSQTVQNDIRSIQSNIQAQLEHLKITTTTSFVKTSDICEHVKSDILDYQDEPHLSKAQNNYRRIFIASEIFIDLCSTFAGVVDHEYAKIISDMMQWEKYKELSRRISSLMQLELRRERYFITEAQEKLLESLEETSIEETDEFPATDKEERESQSEIVTRYGKESLPTHVAEPIAVEPIPSHEMIGTLRPTASPLDTSFTDDVRSNLAENLSTIREAVTADTFHLEPPVLNTLQRERSLPRVESEISVGEPALQQDQGHDDIVKILEILENQTSEKDKGEIKQPESLLEPLSITQEIRAETLAMSSPPSDDHPGIPSEGFEDWSLPNLEEIEKRKRKRNLIIDKEIVIPDYASRAMKLNRSIHIERVQVFEGAPRIVQAISATHLMTTPGRKSSAFRDVRSSNLSTLYSRHLEVEERPVEHPLRQKRVEQNAVDILKPKANAEFVLETMEGDVVRTGMHSIHGRSDVLIEVRDRNRPEIDIPLDVAPPQESLLGIPMSRINSTVEPPGKDEMERINASPVLPGPRVQLLQGKTLEPKTSPPWFYSTYQSPPKSIYRNFSAVYEKLEKYWTLLGYQAEEKCIRLSELFRSEGSRNIADFLTMWRIVDKMSIQRKLLLEYKDGDVLIRPFESPYVSDAQLLLQGKEPIL